MGLPDAMLLDCGKPRIERQNVGRAAARCASRLGEVTAQRVRCVVDLAFAGEEDQDVAVALFRQFIDRIDNGLHLVAVIVGVVLASAERPVANLDGERAAADFDDGCGRTIELCKVLAEPLCIDGGGGDNQFQVGSLR